MAVTASQIDTQIDAAWAAMQVNELSYTVQGRTVLFRTLDEMSRHIEWLMSLQNKVAMQALIDAGSAICPVVQYQGSE